MSLKPSEGSLKKSVSSKSKLQPAKKKVEVKK